MRTYSDLMSASGDGRGHYVELQEAKFLELVREFLAFVVVDEAWYRSRNADVAQAVADGTLASAQAHYIQAGYFENRMPRPIAVDDAWYLAQYPDVAEAIRAGGVASASQHFEHSGFAEGRLPCEDWSLLHAGKTRAGANLKAVGAAGLSRRG